MLDPKISLQTAIASTFWLLGFGLVAGDVFALPGDVGRLGLAFCCGGAVLLIRSFFCAQARHIQQAFELGRDAGRLEEAAPSMRAVPPQRIH